VTMAIDDRRLSPFTGSTRRRWAETADGMLLALRAFASPDHARIDLPGPASAFGRDSDGLEAFARSFLLAAIRLRGEGGTDPHGLAGWYAAGLTAGTDPASPTAWPRPDRLDQAKVEACSIALGLQLTRPWIWDLLDSGDRERIVAWLGTVIGQTYFPNNWVWFQIVVETFLRSVGGPWSAADIDAGLALHESFYQGAGWYTDGSERSYDHYVGWALHTYPLLWADMAGAHCPDARRQAWRHRLSRYLDDAVLLVGGDGAPLLQGRSLTYRFAAAAPYWIGAMTGATNLSPGAIRRVCSGMLGHFTSHGVPDERGLLNLGWHHAWPAMAQAYSGPGSPYWAAKGMFGLSLPADHPVWTAVEEPLPVERGDTLAMLPAPGWLVAGTRSDGVVRVVNHGTDHSMPGDERSDSPLYARLGYSTATLPPLGDAAVARPPDNSVVLVDAAGQATHRNGFERLSCDRIGVAARAVSQARTHWVATHEDTGPDHGAGRGGTVRTGPTVTIGSLVRGAWEVRAARLDSAVGLDDRTVLEFSGWPVTDAVAPVERTAPDPVGAAIGRRLTSVLTGVAGFDTASVRRVDDASPLGAYTAVPVLRTAATPRVGWVYVALVALYGSGGGDPGVPPEVTVTSGPDASAVVAVRWADGVASDLTLPAPSPRP
ncbi:MAG: hypothetical protein QOE03_331, partial [Micromonosporaceae bacterium]|nr:hypothetical protein [Micromonosporaceae bacterium]